MRKYESYKPSGVDWIGVVPVGWKVMKTSWVFRIGSGTTPKSDNKSYYTEEGGFNWLQTGDLNDGRISETSKKITQKALEEYNLKTYRKGSLVIAMYGATIGKVGILDIETTVNQACCVLNKTKDIDEIYAFYLFQAEKPTLLRESYGGGQPNISQDIISCQKIPIPPLHEQIAIADYLDAKCAKIDNVVAVQQKRIELLKELKQSIITHAVTKGLDKNAKMKDSGIEWIGEVPEKWEKCRFKNFITLINKPTVGGNKIGLENIESGSGKFLPSDSEFDGDGVGFVVDDIVYGKLRPYLMKVWVAEFSGNAVGDFFVFRVRDNADSSFVKYLMLSDGFTKEANGATEGAKMPRVSSDFILTLGYYLPQKKEQTSIAEFLDKKCAVIDRQIAKVEKQIEMLNEYKQSVITECVTGKRKVC